MQTTRTSKISAVITLLALAVCGCSTPPPSPPAPPQAPEQATSAFADAHFHISNYAYQGASIRQLLDGYMKDAVARSVVMPLPLQQRWDGFEHYASDKVAPNYYIGPKAELYYYAFADAIYAKEYLGLNKADQARIDLMITGFNPMDLYAPQHIKRALLTFPGAFAGIGEFTVHKEVVSDKIAGQPISQTAKGTLPPDVDADGKLSLYSPAVAQILKLVAETGLVATMHNDLYPAKVSHEGVVQGLYPEKNYETALKALCGEAKGASVIWAHTGLGRFVKPTADHLAVVGRVLDACPTWNVDISWDIVQENIVRPQPGMPSTQEWARFITRYQDRVLWGSDTVLYSRNVVNSAGEVTSTGRKLSLEQYMAVPKLSDTLFAQLGPAVAKKVRIDNYVRLFDAARSKVRAWEAAHASTDVWDLR